MIEQPSVGTRTIAAKHTGHDFGAMRVSVISSLDSSDPALSLLTVRIDLPSHLAVSGNTKRRISLGELFM
jgi:hypothetical protein